MEPALNSRNKFVIGNNLQILIGLFIFFVVFPWVRFPIINVSISFFLFISIALSMKRKIISINNFIDYMVVLYTLCSIVSIFLSYRIGQSFNYQNDIFNIIYIVYWALVYFFFKDYLKYLNITIISRFILLGFLLNFLFLILADQSGTNFNLLGISVTQNAFAYNFSAFFGISLLLIMKKNYGVFLIALYSIIFIYVISITDSRTGISLAIGQIILLFLGLLFFRANLITRLLSSLTLLIAVTILLIDQSMLLNNSAFLLQSFNERFASIFLDTQNLLENDKSLIIRQIQVLKGLELFYSYPLLGVGYGHFSQVQTFIDISHFPNLINSYESYTLHRSPHSSFIQVLAETGILGFFPFCMIFIMILWHSFKAIFFNSYSDIFLPYSISMISVLLYLFMISGHTGTIMFMILGLFNGALKIEKNYEQN